MQNIEKFEGVMESWDIETNSDGQNAVHMVFNPLEKDIIDTIKKSKTNRLHNYIRLSPKTENDVIPDGSSFAMFLREVIIVEPETKKLNSWQEMVEYLKGKKYLFQKKKIGKDYDGHKGRSAYIPIQKL